MASWWADKSRQVGRHLRARVTPEDLDAADRPQLIDFEFSGPTHFFLEDAVRFHALSPAARRQPELFHPLRPVKLSSGLAVSS